MPDPEVEAVLEAGSTVPGVENAIGCCIICAVSGWMPSGRVLDVRPKEGVSGGVAEGDLLRLGNGEATELENTLSMLLTFPPT